MHGDHFLQATYREFKKTLWAVESRIDADSCLRLPIAMSAV